MESQTQARDTFLESITRFYSSLPQVAAFVLSGSETTGVSDSLSDLDFYAYVTAEIPVETRRSWILPRAGRCEIDNRVWETGDEWTEADGAFGADVMYRDPAWMEDQLARVLVRHEASAGYSTCFWFNVLNSRILFDRSGWFENLQRSARCEYPEPLRAAIIRKNLPLLRDNISSFLRQIQKAVAREDSVSRNHRVAAFLASYFDILFALNRLPHPGEKRLVAYAEQHCVLLPAGFRGMVEALIQGISVPARLPAAALSLTEGLEFILGEQGLRSGLQVAKS